ncbi:hypothetical protein DdX_18851 [Ditylenchus destructor]|uniref:Uncharacterized protein n=1 Tax=Ditylenchus destructor TaxID=166010 RepID=A0AAD4MNQ6_9BILA|nr:hypothetical protein DdX_18851 [Ditylenchus destructor]
MMAFISNYAIIKPTSAINRFVMSRSCVVLAIFIGCNVIAASLIYLMLDSMVKDKYETMQTVFSYLNNSGDPAKASTIHDLLIIANEREPTLVGYQYTLPLTITYLVTLVLILSMYTIVIVTINLKIRHQFQEMRDLVNSSTYRLQVMRRFWGTFMFFYTGTFLLILAELSQEEKCRQLDSSYTIAGAKKEDGKWVMFVQYYHDEYHEDQFGRRHYTGKVVYKGPKRTSPSGQTRVTNGGGASTTRPSSRSQTVLSTTPTGIFQSSTPTGPCGQSRVLAATAAATVNNTASESLSQISAAAGGLAKNDAIVSDATSRIEAGEKDAQTAMDSAVNIAETACAAAGADQTAINAANAAAVTAINAAQAAAATSITAARDAAITGIQAN